MSGVRPGRTPNELLAAAGALGKPPRRGACPGSPSAFRATFDLTSARTRAAAHGSRRSPDCEVSHETGAAEPPLLPEFPDGSMLLPKTCCPVVSRLPAGNLGAQRREPLLLVAGSVVIALWLVLFMWVGWRRRKRGGGGASTAEAWSELFHPSQRHVQQERERQLVLRDDAESGAPPSSVDLDSGKAVIRPMRSPTSRHDAP
ncbi:DUF6191 domain-containing protein [Streptomyces sp. NPDC005969]|uniref:DUF6191 domain-containing protein n=1 Tax=Streptomyces sp. NPDC005969 TaxID=3156722 RepID=UPI0033C43B32